MASWIRTDEELVRACREGDESAWEAVVRRYQRLVYSVPRQAGLAEDAAADVFQKVFAGLFEHLDDLSQPERLSAWLVTLAMRETLRTARAASLRRGGSLEDLPATRVVPRRELPAWCAVWPAEGSVARVCSGTGTALQVPRPRAGARRPLRRTRRRTSAS